MKSKIKTAIPFIVIFLVLLVTSSCATVRLNPSNRAEQVTVTFDKTIK